MRTNYFGSASSFALADHAIAWEKEAYDVQPRYTYPASDLIDTLLVLYFTNVHPTTPILHRPSFERSVAEGLHLADPQFGGLLLSVLALASRYSKDPRVFVDGDASLSAGWSFYNQIWILRKKFEPTIYEVQMYCLLTLYCTGISATHISWLYLGIGIRCLHQRGEHQRKGCGGGPEDELWKRAFWSFIALERMVCAFTGRPMSLQAEEYDLDLPFEVDDEYWDQGFTQPPEKPESQLSYFLADLRLCEIWGDAMRRLYAPKKLKTRMGWDTLGGEQSSVATFDSRMNDFLDSIPPHLRWDPDSPPEDDMFFDQSVILHLTYNFILIAIHRPYIHKATVLAAPSLSICATAARTILRAANMWLSKLQRIPLPNLINPVFVSGIILVMNMLATKCVGLEKNKDISLVGSAMEILKVAESRYHTAGRLLDIVREVRSFYGLFHPPNDHPDSFNAESVPGSSSFESTNESTSTPGLFLPNIHDVFYPQHEQLFQPVADSTLPYDQSSGPRPGMSIEQLLADTERPDATKSIFGDELMSMWMAVPTDVADISGWDAYIESRNGPDVNWFPSFPQTFR
ncbi:Zn(2)-C6 fungal-type domain-containing protein [Mycena venus]|uniref:Zn(2)-C6 fungal-type domain-containing protein n=1 Tax=Mycena venus TaxID=2733690 RepID=A0A8H6XVF4_9AGAR|nr:Zn(2)-C6 fungal-type domain-containing protein [Mycena venus]